MTWYVALMLITIGFCLGSIVAMRTADQEHARRTAELRRILHLTEEDR